MTKKTAKAKKLTPRQKRLALLMPHVEGGEMTLEEALLKAGFAASTAKQQTATMNRVRKNSVMQEALRKAGFTEELIAEKVMEGLAATKGFTIKMGQETVFEQSEDFLARHKYLETGAKLLDAFPASKNLHSLVDPDELLDQTEKDGEYAPWQDAS